MPNSMPMIFLRKLIVIAIDLVILILIQVKANDLAFASLCQSLVQNTLPYPFIPWNVIMFKIRFIFVF